MFQPRRSIKNIQPLPSIYTAFPPTYDRSTASEHSGKCLIRRIEEGIEVVPIERCNILSAPILSPDQAEKEVLIISQKELGRGDKPLPILPRTLWGRLSVKQRIVAIVFVQAALLLTIGLALLAVKSRPSSGGYQTTQIADLSDPQARDAIPIERGTFSLPIPTPQQQSSACLSRTNESVAWQCASDTSFQLAILPSYGKSNKTLITLGALATPDRTIYHGHQAPEIRTIELTKLQNNEGGLSYHFRTTYDRIVYLTENDLSLIGTPRAQPIMRHLTFVPGESLWRCTFNETLIEGFVYPNKTTLSSPPTNTTTGIVMELPRMPHVMKLVEQRMPNGRTPYCEKMKLGYDGKMEIVNGGEKVMLRVAEPVAEINADAARKEAARDVRLRGKEWGKGKEKEKRQSDAQSYCKCQWFVE